MADCYVLSFGLLLHSDMDEVQVEFWTGHQKSESALYTKGPEKFR